MNVKCVVAAINADGEPDFHFVRVECTEDQYGNGYHYDAAMKDAVDEGYDPKLAYDENDAGGKAIMDHFVWESAKTVKAHHPFDLCRRCGSEIDSSGKCVDVTCPYSDRQQNETFTEG